MSNDDYAISDDWQKHKDFRTPFDFVLEPIKDNEGNVIRARGQKLLLRHVEMPDLLKHGLAAELDFMTKEIMKGDDKPNKEVVSDAITNADALLKMEAMVNAVCLAGIIKPKIYPVPDDTAQKRQTGLLYVDQIPWDDRQELFSVIFDSAGLSDFREEQEPDVGNVADVQELQLPADGPVEHTEDNPERVLSQ
jgi:hypothetical protein